MLRRFAVEAFAAIGPVVFLACALRPGCGFNFIPFALHQALVRDVMDETLFIHIFDILVAVLLFLLIRRLITAAFPGR
jgi:hypothetical protein